MLGGLDDELIVRNERAHHTDHWQCGRGRRWCCGLNIDLGPGGRHVGGGCGGGNRDGREISGGGDCHCDGGAICDRLSQGGVGLQR